MKPVLKVALSATMATVLAVGAPVASAHSAKVGKKKSRASAAAGWIYVNGDDATPNKNAVVAIPYSSSGIPLIAKSRLFPTAGTGTSLVLPLPNSVGTTAGDHQVLLSTNDRLLFAVNQGSNSIAVFHVNSATGALKPVKGSPFYSGGLAPIGLGFAHNVLVVANHGIIAPFNPLGNSPPGPSDLVSFSVSPSGALKELSSTAPDPDGLIDATISPSGSEIVTSGFYPEVDLGQPFPTFSPQLIRSVGLSSTGTLTQDDAFSFPASFTAGLSGKVPSFIPPVLYPLPFGVAFNPNPSVPYVYINATVAGQVAVYNYSNPADLTLASSTPNPGPMGPTAACWIAISSNGRYLYDSDSVSQAISTFSISPDGSTLTRLSITPLKSTGTSDALELDPTGQWLYVLGNHDDPDSPRPEGISSSGAITPAPLPANYLDAYSVNASTGAITEISTVKLPVPTADLPYGVAILKKS